MTGGCLVPVCQGNDCVHMGAKKVLLLQQQLLHPISMSMKPHTHTHTHRCLTFCTIRVDLWAITRITLRCCPPVT